jgi:DNA repair protein RAD50
LLPLDTDEELKEWQTKFEERITLMETKIGKLEREMNDEKTSTSSLSVTMNDLTLEIGKLQAEANVML